MADHADNCDSKDVLHDIRTSKSLLEPSDFYNWAAFIVLGAPEADEADQNASGEKGVSFARGAGLLDTREPLQSA